MTRPAPLAATAAERSLGAGPALSRAAFDRFSAFITRELGIKMPPEKLPMLQSRLQRRVRQLELDSLEAYQEHLFHSPDAEQEMIEFINLVTTNKTDFLREPQHFEYLARTALPALEDAAAGALRLEVWCAGCSTGEEVYTLGMVLGEWQRTRPGSAFSLLATDISTRVLERARAAVYTEAQIAPVPLEWRRRYLLRSRNPDQKVVRVVPELREKVRFGRLNFMSPDYGLRTMFEVIFFRNVLIYFDRPTQEAILRKMCRHLQPGGFLFVSHAESLVGLDLPLQNLGNSTFRKDP